MLLSSVKITPVRRLMFFCAFMGNLTTCMSILLRAEGWDDYKTELPFLPGYVGTLLLDLTVISQHTMYGPLLESWAKRHRALTPTNVRALTPTTVRPHQPPPPPTSEP